MSAAGAEIGEARQPWIGTSRPRTEDLRLLRGEGRFVADLAEPNDGHVAFLRSPLAHGRIETLDLTAAIQLPGVIAAYSASDLSNVGSIGALTVPGPEFSIPYGFGMTDHSLECLASTVVRYVGQPVAMVVATSRAIAEDAVDLIDLAIDPLSVDDQPVVAESSFELGAKSEEDETFTTVEIELHMARHAGVPIETRGVRACPTESAVRVTTSTQIPHLVKNAIMAATSLEADQLHVDVVDVGGGFGTKANVYPEEVLLAVVCERLARPIVWIEDRTEHFISAAQGRDQSQRVRLTVDAEGMIRSFEIDLSIDLGAGSLWTAGMLANSCIHLLGPYRLPHVKVNGRAHLSHRIPSAQYRGAGRPEACFALERSLDAAALKLGLGRTDIRQRNLYRSDEFPVTLELPYRDGVPISFDGGDWQQCLDDAVAARPRVDHDERATDDEVLGWGTACVLEATGRGPFESARVWARRDGRIQLMTGGASAGQGHQTVFAQVVADALGVEPDQVDVHLATTDGLADGIGTFGSRTAVLAGSATHQVADELRHRLHLATDSSPSSTMVIAPEGVTVEGVTHTWDGLLDTHGDEAFDVTQRFSPPTVTWTMGAHAVLVAVDPGTGATRVLDYAVAHEGGRDINPAIVVGQVRGGVAQGLGGALLERNTYDDELQPTAVNFADYQLPTAHDVPNISVHARHIPTPSNPLGVRGVGESGTIGVYAAVASAIDDAVRKSTGRDPESGIFVSKTPMNAQAVRELVAAATSAEP